MEWSVLQQPLLTFNAALMPQLQARRYISWNNSVKLCIYASLLALRANSQADVSNVSCNMRRVRSAYLSLDDVPGISQAYVVF